MSSTTQTSADRNQNPSVVSGSSATHLHYTCLPSSSALSQNAYVTLAVRSFHTNIHPSTLKRSLNNGNTIDHGTQLYVSAQALGIGQLPLHSNTVDSIASTLLQPMSNHLGGESGSSGSSNIPIPTMNVHNANPQHLQQSFSTDHYFCTWDDVGNSHTNNRNNTQYQCSQFKQHHNILTLPIRYKDLSHDACLKLEIYTSRNKLIGTVLLKLWDEKKRLNMGLQKVKVDLHGPSYSNGESPLQERMNAMHLNEKIAKNIDFEGKEETDKECRNNNEKYVDEKWEACLILDKLQQIELMNKSKKEISIMSCMTSDSSTIKQQQQQHQQQHQQQQQEKHHGQYQMEDLNITMNGLNNCNSMQSVPWLDSLTKQYCMNVLRNKNAKHEITGSNDNNNENVDLTGGGRSTTDTTANSIAHILKPDTFTDGGICASNGSAYLIVEMESCDIPIVYHEQSYGSRSLQGGASAGGSSTNLIGNASGNSGGVNGGTLSNSSSASGSITALDLSLYHHQHMKQQRMGEVQNINAILMPHLVHALNESQEMGMKLVQVLDFESVYDNPVEDKYRTLQHELLRGLVDPALKPDASERSQLDAIISGTSQHLTREEKDLLWRFRFSLVDNRRALTKFLLAVEWTVESEVVQAAELLEQWRKRSPIEVSDALKLLGKNVAFQTGLVRAYAIDTLALADDGELVLYLLQLVQALKYENNTDEQTGLNSLKQFWVSTDAKKGSKNNSLATFLIERASKNIQLANYLYWYLKVELEDHIYGQRYKEVFMALKAKLSTIPYKVESDKRQHGQSKFTPLSGVLDSVSKIGASNSKKVTSIYRTMWKVLESQDQFINDILECQLESQGTRGKKDAKEKHLRESLQKKGCHTINNGLAVPLPSAPQIWIVGVKADSARMFKSALYPALLEFYVDQHSSNDDSKSSGSSSRTYRVMVKTGDDLRQDQLVIMLIKLMDRILKRGTLDLFLKPYPILAMPDRTGLVEFVPDSMAISQILAENNNSILEFFQKVAPSPGSKYNVDPNVMQTYVRSCAGYCVITYLIGVGDRHLDNIMLQRSGHFFHIDFGFIFGRDPKPLPPAFRLTREMVDGMGGQESQEYQQFCSLACQAYNLLRKRAGLVLNLLHLMSDAGIEDLSNNPSADAEGVIAEVEKRFKLDLSDEQAESYFVQLIKESLSALAPQIMDIFHQISVARR